MYSSSEINKAFLLLDIPYTLDKNIINKAWKSKAIMYHPDKAISDIKKEEFHNKFIELIKARDICLSLINISLKESEDWEDIDDNYSEKDYPKKDQEDIEAEREWDFFVADEKKYFSSAEFIYEATLCFLKISFHSICLSLLSTFIGLEVLLLCLGILSMAPDLPRFIWIFTPVSLIFLIFYEYRYLVFLDLFILKNLIHTGYPIKFYVLLWVIENFFFIILLTFQIYGAIYIFLIGNLGFLIQFQRIKYKIHKIEEILQKQSNENFLQT